MLAKRPAPTSPPAAPGVRVRPVPAVSRAIAILRLLGKTDQALGVKAVADELELVPSTALHILRVLVSEDLVKVDPATKRYSLGTGMISLARSVLREGGFAQLVQPALDRVAQSHGVTAMGVELTTRNTIMVLALSRSNQPFRFHTDVGSQFSSFVSATGRLAAAYGGETWTQLRKRFGAIEWDRAPSFDTWKKEVELARERGWAVDRDNFLSGLTAVAVPVFSAGGRFKYGLAAIGLTGQLDETTTSALATTMRAEAQALSERLVEVD
ncbi:IclR family transcriptional regulator [Ramlibacter sp. G-1-2-2]|uniref:IclR family transcriptional regulator n=1 Tax=Ramlibacter agri TaxID=2728837 RepID=A0A848H584_9BURK|nr:IclR family transcriptional regulator [Ramlibacter agri]NML44400.1 IclR family transcriptional regulator [Ramlibacter agri]